MRIDAVRETGKIVAMKIHLNRSGQSLGQFTPDEVRAGYREGKFTGTDLAWRDGMDSWRPLSEVIDEIAPEYSDSIAPPLPPAAGGLPWENRADTGFFAALFETIRSVLLEPKAAFSAMKPSGGLGAPLFFYVFVATIGAVAGLFYQVFFNSFQTGGSPEQKAWEAALSSTVAIGAGIMLMPVVLVIMAFVTAAFAHLALIIVGGARRPFEATFRVVCYAGGATAVLQLLPVCGAVASSIWNFVCMVIGISEVHGIGKGRAAIAVLLPSLVCCGIFVAGIVFVIASLGGMEAFLQAVEQAQQE